MMNFNDRLSLSDVFNKTVAQIRLDFPAEANEIAFIDFSAPDAHAQIHKWFDELPQQSQAWLLGKYNMGSDRLLELYLEQYGVAENVPGGKKLLGVQSNGTTGDFFGADLVKATVMTILHEFGHLIVENGAAPPKAGRTAAEHIYSHNMAENAADSFASIYARKMGVYSTEDIQDISDRRALRAWFGLDVLHTTSFALDAIHVGRDDADFISLSSQEIKSIAAVYAVKFTPTGETLLAAEKTLSFSSPQEHQHRVTAEGPKAVLNECIHTLVDICKDLPDNSYSRAIGIKTVRKLNAGKIIDINLAEWNDAGTLLAQDDSQRANLQKRTPGGPG